jgi:uncharacterized protein YqeY
MNSEQRTANNDMNSLKDKIFSDCKEALRQKDELKVSTLRLLAAAFLNREKEKRQKIAKTEEGLSEKGLIEKSQLSDEEILEVIISEIKKRKESISEFKKGKRQDLVQKETEELEVLKKYLPKQLSSEELKQLINNAIKETGGKEMKDMGKVMGVLMSKIKGRTDASQAAEFVREILSQ